MLRSFASKHALGIIGSQTGNRLARLVRAFLVFKALDEADANRFMWLSSAALVASVLSDFGLRNTVYAELGRLDRDDRTQYLGKVFGWKLIASTAVLCTLPLYVRWSQGDSWGAAVLTAILAIHVYVADPGVQVLRGAALGQLELVVFIVDSLIPLAFMVLFWLTGPARLEAVLAVWALSAVVRSLLTWRLVRVHVGRFAVCYSLRSTVKFAAERVAPGLVLLLFLFHLRFPVLASPYVGLEEKVGVLALVLMIVQSFQIVPAIVSNVMIPIALTKRRDTEISALTFPSVLLNLIIGTLAAAALFMAAEPILRLGRVELAADAPLLKIACVALPFICANQMLRLLAIAAGVRAPLLISMSCAVGVAVTGVSTLALAFGAPGAAWGYVGSEVLLFGVLVLLVRRRVSV